MIEVGSQATIEFEGQTEPGKLSWYTLRVWVESDQAAETMLAEYSEGSSVTVAESGGGSVGWVLLVGMLGVGLAMRRKRTRLGPPEFSNGSRKPGCSNRLARPCRPMSDWRQPSMSRARGPLLPGTTLR